MYCIVQSAAYISGANRPNTLILHNVNNENNPYASIPLYFLAGCSNTLG